MSIVANSDVENPADRNGYPALAEWMARNPEYETFIFRRFDRLSARNLLHLESQVSQLEGRLELVDGRALQQTIQNPQNLEMSRSIRSWEVFSERAQDHSLLEHRRMALVNEIGEKLKQYHEALLLQSQIAAMDKPRRRALEVLRNFFLGEPPQHCKGVSRRPVLAGRAESRLDDKQDLIALRRPIDKDMLSRFLQDNWVFKTTTIPKNGTEHIKEQHIQWAVAAINTAVAALLLIGAIIALHFTYQAGTRLGLIAAFTALFALSLVLLTNAKRAEIFAATAAYAAVLVVFVSGDLGAD